MDCYGDCTVDWWLGDGVYDDVLNCSELDWDAGDCSWPLLPFIPP